MTCTKRMSSHFLLRKELFLRRDEMPLLRDLRYLTPATMGGGVRDGTAGAVPGEIGPRPYKTKVALVYCEAARRLREACERSKICRCLRSDLMPWGDYVAHMPLGGPRVAWSTCRRKLADNMRRPGLGGRGGRVVWKVVPRLGEGAEDAEDPERRRLVEAWARAAREAMAAKERAEREHGEWRQQQWLQQSAQAPYPRGGDPRPSKLDHPGLRQ